MTLRNAIEGMRAERPDLAEALAELLPHDSPTWDIVLPDDLWNHDVFEDVEEEYAFLRGVVTDDAYVPLRLRVRMDEGDPAARMQLGGWGDIPGMRFMTVMLCLGCLDPV